MEIEKGRGEERSGFSYEMEISRGKCIEKASGHKRINATINYLCAACEGACTSAMPI